MTSSEPNLDRARTRREPPPFRAVQVLRREALSPRLHRITFGSPELDGLVIAEPAASIRLLIPSAPAGELVRPAWTGNEFLLPDGHRPVIRTFTPRRFEAAALELDIDVVIHGPGPASDWAVAARPGAAAAVSGPGRGYSIDPDAGAFLLAGDESAVPAMSQLLEHLGGATPVTVIVEVATDDARPPVPVAPGVTVDWRRSEPGAPPGAALATAVRDATLPDGIRIWAAGEAAAMQRIRRYLFDERAVPRSATTIRGYWKVGRAGVEAP